MLLQGRTDLADEAQGQLLQSAKSAGTLPGVAARRERLRGLEVTAVEVMDQQGAQALGKPVGRYFTLELPERFGPGAEGFADCVQALAELLRRCMEAQPRSVLVAALGNPDITPDALGSLAAGSVLVTRHLKQSEPETFAGFSSLALCRPGVLGTAGVESAVQVRSMCRELGPELVVAIDALAGADAARLCRTIQITDSGLAPGSGVGNDRQELSRGSLGLPVLAVGMPTVIDAAALGCHEAAGMFVTPRDIDALVRQAARVIGFGLDLALHPGVSIDDIQMLLG